MKESIMYEEYKKNVEKRFLADTFLFRYLNLNELSWNKVRTIFKTGKISDLTSFFFYLKWLNQNGYKLDDDYIIFLNNNDDYFDFKKRKNRNDLRMLTDYSELKDFYIRISSKELKLLYLPYKSKLLKELVLQYSKKTKIIKYEYFNTFLYLEQAVGFELENEKYSNEKLIDNISRYFNERHFVCSKDVLYDIFKTQTKGFAAIVDKYLNNEKNPSIIITQKTITFLFDRFSNWNIIRNIIRKLPFHEVNSIFYLLAFQYKNGDFVPNYLKKFFENNIWAFDFEKDRFRIDLRVLANYDNLDDIFISKIGNEFSGLKLFYLPYKSHKLQEKMVSFIKEYKIAIKPKYFPMFEHFEESVLDFDEDFTKWSVYDFKKVIDYFHKNNIAYIANIISAIFVYFESKDLKKDYYFLNNIFVYRNDLAEYDFFELKKYNVSIPKNDKIYIINPPEDLKKSSSGLITLSSRSLNFSLIQNSKIKEIIKEELLTNFYNYKLKDFQLLISETASFYNTHDEMTLENYYSTLEQVSRDKCILLKRIAKILVKNNLLDENVLNFSVIKKRRKNLNTIDTNTLLKILTILKNSNKSVFIVLYYYFKIIFLTKNRIGSLQLLNLDDIYIKGKQSYVRWITKTQNYDEYPITPYAYQTFMECIEYTSKFRNNCTTSIINKIFIFEKGNLIKLFDYNLAINSFKHAYPEYSFLTSTLVRKRAITNDNEYLELLTGLESYNQALDIIHTPNSSVVKQVYTIKKENTMASYFKQTIGNFDSNGNYIIDASDCEELPKIQDCFLCPYFHPNDTGKCRIKELNVELKIIHRICKNQFESNCLKNMIKALDRKETEHE